MLLSRSSSKASTSAARSTWCRLPLQRLRPLSTAHPRPNTKPSFSTPAYGLTSSTSVLRSAERRAVERRVSLDDFKRLAENDTATIVDAKLCLKQTRADIERMPADKRQDACAEQQAGGRVMLWSISRALSDPDSHYIDRDLSELIGWLAVPEAREDYVFAWIARELEQPRTPYVKSEQHLSPTWRSSTLLRGLVKSHLSWSSTSPDPALRCFKKAISSFGHHWSSKYSKGLLMRALMEIEAVLCSTQYPVSDPELFDFIVEELWRRGPPPLVEEVRAKYATYHPTRPQGKPMANLLRNWPSSVEGVWSALPPARNRFGMLVLRAAWILRRQGEENEAQWLESVIVNRCEAVWHARDNIFKRCQADPRLASLSEHGDS